MNTKEKAIELYNKFRNENSFRVCCVMTANIRAKKQALIAVNEIIKQFDGLHKPEYCAFDAIGDRKFTFESEYPEHMTGYDMVAYWEDVKVQIEALS